MSWETLAWRPADASHPEGIAPLLSEADTIKSALEEAVAAMVMGPVTIAALDVATLDSPSDLPEGFSIVATFELLGKGRLPLAVALDPSGGDRLAGSVFDVAELGRRLADELDAVVGFIAGEGLQVGAPEDAAFVPDEKLILARFTLADASGGEARLVAAVDAEAPADLGMHLILVKEMGKITLEPPNKPKAAAASTAAAPEATQPSAAATPEPTPVPGAAGYPGAPGGYPAQPGFPGGYPAQAGYPAQPGYPATPSGYPGMQPGYPAMPTGTPGYAAQAGAYPPNVRPLTLDELAGGIAAGPGSSMDLLYGVNLEVTVEIGRTRLPIRDVLALTPGSIVELDKLAGEKVDVLVNGHLIASGEVVVVDENFGVRITDVSARARRMAMAEGVA